MATQIEMLTRMLEYAERKYGPDSASATMVRQQLKELRIAPEDEDDGTRTYFSGESLRNRDKT